MFLLKNLYREWDSLFIVWVLYISCYFYHIFFHTAASLDVLYFTVYTVFTVSLSVQLRQLTQKSTLLGLGISLVSRVT